MTTVIDIVNDGLSDEELATHTAAWLSDLRAAATERSSQTAAEVLDRLHAAGEL